MSFWYWRVVGVQKKIYSLGRITRIGYAQINYLEMGDTGSVVLYRRYYYDIIGP